MHEVLGFSVISVTFLCVCVCLISDLGDPACGIRVFRCRVQTEVHCSHSVGVSDHFTSARVVHAQTQQETHFLLLASCCGWRFTHLHSQYPTSYIGLVLKSIPYCTCPFFVLLFRMFSIPCLQQSSLLS